MRHTDAAFAGDPTLLDLLGKMRALLLTSTDRFQVNMLDVPEGETHGGKDWRTQLRQAGIPDLPNNFAKPKPLRLGQDDPGPPPELPPLQVGDPVPTAWKGRYIPIDRDDPELVGRPTSTSANTRRLAYSAAAFGGLFAAGWAFSHRRGRKSAI